MKAAPVMLRRAYSAEERNTTDRNIIARAQDSKIRRTRSEKISLYGHSSSRSASTNNLCRSQSMATLGGEKAVLGESFRGSYSIRSYRTAVLKELGLNAKSISRIPKHPKPRRTIDTFNAVINGLRDHIKAAEDEYNHTDEECRLRNSASQSQKLKSIERHKKKLEYLLSKIEELQDHYLLQNQMREGTKTLSKAYEQSCGLHKKDSLVSVHYGFKECSKMMCAIEAQLESMLGQFHCEMKGIIGFARVMPGDCFEVSVRHGNQKWKSKGSVSKDSEQDWDGGKRALTVQPTCSLIVKVFESKRLSRSSLGVKHCDILCLFAASPQILTVNVNDIGTIKLNIMVQWMPLANFTEQMKFFNPPPRQPVSPRPLSLVSCLSSEGQTAHNDIIVSSNKSDVVSPRPDLLCDMKDDHKAYIRTPVDSIDEEDEQESYQWPRSLEKGIKNLQEALQDYREHSNALQLLCSVVNELDTLLQCKPMNYMKQELSEAVKKKSKTQEAQERRNSSISLAIETAFDFLNGEDVESDSEDSDETLSPSSTARSKADSGIESLLAHHNTLTRSISYSTYSSGNEDLDLVIIQHCALSHSYLQNLDNVGMLKSKEEQAMEALRLQKKILSIIAQLVKRLTQQMDTRIHAKKILSDLAPDLKDAHEFWLKNTKTSAIYMTVPEFSKALYVTFNAAIKETYEINPEKVFNAVLKKMTQAGRFSTENQKHIVISLYQFLCTIQNSKCRTLDYYIHEMASEEWMLNQIKSDDHSVKIRAIKSLNGAKLSSDIVKSLLALITSQSSEVVKEISDFWVNMSFDGQAKEAVLPLVIACLEDSRIDIRTGACICLHRLKATAAKDQLMYVAQADSSKRVQSAARSALAGLSDLWH